jgi:CxxC motif-containing protein
MDRKITCIGCPLGCEITVKTAGGNTLDITGYTCKKGEEYARTEATDPRRTLTTTMRVSGGGLIPVKTNRPIKKGLLFDCMKEINKAEANGDADIGDVLIKDILGTGSDIVAAGRQ